MPLPVLSIAEMREWEQATWASGQNEKEVIRQVGLCVAQYALRLTRPTDLILIFAGKGNNGQDACAARDHLHGRRIELLEVSDPARDFTRLEELLAGKPALILDGLFGIGLNRPLGPEWTRFIQRINEARLHVLSIDVPSGLNADTGEAQGAAVQATVTLTIGAPKTGLLSHNAWPFVGRLEVATDVGLAPCPSGGDVKWALPTDFAHFPPQRPAATHKGTYGHLAILSGSLGYHGAAVLAARAAQRAQPGLITLYTLESVYHSIAPQLQAVMVSPWHPDVKLPGTYSAILIGPGLAAPDATEQMKMVTRHLWRDATVPVIVDASALDWLPLDTGPKNALRVITPHPGEAARLISVTSNQVQANRFVALRNVSRRFGNTWVVLKGHQTLIGRSTGEIFVNSSGNPHLAQGGSGDVLAGYLAGLLAQPGLRADPLRTIRYAVWQHGAAADRLQTTKRNWIVEDLIEALGQADPTLGPA